MNYFNFTKAFSDGDFSAWLIKLEFVMNANGVVTNEQKAKILPVYLEGQALEIYLGFPENVKLSYVDACKTLKLKFQNDRFVSKGELDNCTQGISEPFESLAFRINKLVSEVYPEFSAQNRLKISYDKFIDAIPKDYAREIIKDSGILDLDQAVEKCRRLKSIEAISSCSVNQDTSSTQMNNDLNSILDKKLEPLLKQIEKIQQELADESVHNISRVNRSMMICYYCGKSGHKIADCRRKIDEDRSRNHDRTQYCNSVFRGNEMLIKVEIDNIVVEGLLDTGSSISLISQKIYKNYFNQYELQYSNITLRDAQGSVMAVVGTVNLLVSYKNVQSITKFFVVKTLSKNAIFGLDFFVSFRLRVVDSNNNSLMNASSSTITNSVMSVSCSEDSLEDSVDASDIPVLSYLKYNIPSEPKSLQNLFNMYYTVFSNIPGRCLNVEHNIELLHNTICKVPPRQYPIQYRDSIKSQINDLLNKNIIRPSRSPYCAPLVIVPKKDKSLRICVDYRELNKVTKKSAYPLPLVADVQNRLQGSVIFSTIDLMSGYWQIPIAESDIEKTAFSFGHEFGLYEFLVMPFGLTGAPSTFQRLMNDLFRDVACVIVYMDDIIVFSKSYDKHIRDLEIVLNILSKNNLTINPNKSKFAVSEVNYLGFEFNIKGMKPESSKVESIKNFPTPQSQKEVQRFLGMASYYRRHIKNFSEIAKPLYLCCEKPKQFIWTQQEHNAFRNLIDLLITEPVLCFPDISKQYQVFTDASNIAIGGVLEQEGRVIAYASRILNKAEQKYSTYELEALAIVFVLKTWRHYLIGNTFVLYTDHEPLKWLLSHKIGNSKVARWLLTIQEFDFLVEYRKGSDNKNADALSRICLLTEVESLLPDTKLKSEQLMDKNINEVINNVKTNNWNKSNLANGIITKFYKIRHQLVVIDGILHRKYSRYPDEPIKCYKIIPDGLKKDLISHCHDSMLSCHLGHDKTLDKILRIGYWPGVYSDTWKYVNECEKCAMANRSQHKAPLTQVCCGKAWDIISIDILELPKFSENNYLLVCQDFFTKWLEAIPIKNQNSNTIVDALMNIFCRLGFPRKIHSDQGRNFESWLFKEMCSKIGIEKSRTTPYHPQGNGLVERANRSIIGMLRKTLEKEHDWENSIKFVTYAYNTSRHSSTLFSPYELMFGRTPDNLILDDKKCVDEFGQFFGVSKNIAKIWEEAELNLSQSKNTQKFTFDKVYSDPWHPNSGESVYLRIPSKSKISRVWESGWSVENVKGKVVEIVNREGKIKIVSSDLLKSDPKGNKMAINVNPHWEPPSFEPTAVIDQPRSQKYYLREKNKLKPPDRYPYSSRGGGM